jgi:hypothetical protein
VNIDWWYRLDGLAHFLYQPTALGRRTHTARWHHHVHLIPRSLLAAVCVRYDGTMR